MDEFVNMATSEFVSQCMQYTSFVWTDLLGTQEFVGEPIVDIVVWT